MIRLNTHYADLKDSYLFYHIAQKTKAYAAEHPGTHLLRLGIGDVSQPLCPAVIDALREAVCDQAEKETFHGYMPECGAPFLRETIAAHYAKRGAVLSPAGSDRTAGTGIPPLLRHRLPVDPGLLLRRRPQSESVFRGGLRGNGGPSL